MTLNITNKLNLTQFDYYRYIFTQSSGNYKMQVEIENSENLIKVFFYGTLKRGEPNSEHLLNRNVTFMTEGVTVDKWPLVVGTDFNIPFLLCKKGVGKVALSYITLFIVVTNFCDFKHLIFIECSW